MPTAPQWWLVADIRIFSLARKLGLQSNALIAALDEMGVPDVTPASAVDEDTAQAVAELLVEQAKEAQQRARAEAEAQAAAGKAQEPETVKVEEAEWEEEEYEKLPVHAAELKEGLAELEQRLAELQAEAEAEKEAAATVKPLSELVARPSGPPPEGAIEVPPVVTVLGHVDHGKTTLLDALRDTEVVATESGGITQHIGASEITVDGNDIVFIDTPGHEAFTAMRARGAQVTDVAVLIVAADDGVMPQTVEAINHVKAAGVPMVVAINKIDLPEADVERVKQQLLGHELVPEDWGGETIVVPISALEQQRLDELLEMLLLVAEVQQLWADPDADPVGVVIESSIDDSEGPLASVLIRNGTLSVGDVVICGTACGRVRRLRDWQGKSVKSMSPGHPVEVVGLSEVVEAGEIMQAAASLKEARQIMAERQGQQREEQLAGGARQRLREFHKDLTIEEAKELNIIVKGDVWGSVEVMAASLQQLSEEFAEVDIRAIYTGVGEVNESDIMLAVASQALVLAFRVPVNGQVRQAARDERVEIRTYDVIYEALDDVRKAMLGLLEPIYEERLIGQAEVLELFKISRTGVAAGCRVTEGHLQQGTRMVVLRDGEQVYEGALESLRHFNGDVATIAAPQECGVSASEFRDWQEGDVIQAYVQVEVERTMETARKSSVS